MSTYIQGFRFKKGDITKKKISAVCSILSKSWGIDVIPEPITEGGIQVLVPIGYKSIRFQFIVNWPFIKGGEREGWIDDNENFIFHNIKNRGTMLKGFGGAVWNMTEIRDVVKAFEENKIEIFSSTLPKKKDLIGQFLW